MKKIVVIGTGRMGGAFATAFAKRTSHAVSIRGSHAGSSSTAALSRQLGVRVADDKELLAAVECCKSATPQCHPRRATASLKLACVSRLRSRKTVIHGIDAAPRGTIRRPR